MKSCSKCGIVKPLLSFHTDKSKPDLKRPDCKECFGDANRVRDKARKHILRENNFRRDLGYQLKYKYGITLEEYDTLLETQEHCCAVCKTKYPGPHRRVFCVDHDHETGLVRGLLCDRCNSGIGMLGDTLQGVEDARNYLKRFYAD